MILGTAVMGNGRVLGRECQMCNTQHSPHLIPSQSNTPIQQPPEKVSRRIDARKQARVWGAFDDDAVAISQVDWGDTIGRERCLMVKSYLNRDDRIFIKNDRAAEAEVGRNGDDDKVGEFGRQDGASGRERIRCRTCGGGNDDTIRNDGRDQFVIDGQIEVENTRLTAAADHNLIQRDF